ncbi:Cof-type HAD-IIB family hydrolase [Oscillatoria sp. CS-180]|uniref:Cof-type HAD-IIB family hydrolase n=1 Tax=Oscillatoria sp. CS-180 TaxID=3021720 RepID=UPI00232AC25D|nr:Cof-type HAD-IIB family hydrolase [Oscillatoria sp. CS-180]MDB9527770.1 Cof-type HAD-IIB family hydrolase [Oscillatoria sp. CS-180]
MTNIRLLVLDIDGTIAGRSNEVTDGVRDAIAEVQAKGVQVAIATGRMYRSALRFHQAVRSPLPLMSYQGALIKDPIAGKVYRHTPLSRQHTLGLLAELATLEAEDKLSIHLYINDQLHVRQILTDTKEYAARSGIEPIAVGDLATYLQTEESIETTKLLALSPDPTVITDLLAQFKQLYLPEELYLTQSVATFFEATHPLSNKGSAVQYLTEDLLNLNADQVMTVGDNFNDFEMIRYAGVGVAMGDAPDGVKAIADWVAPSVEEDGVVSAIEQFILD